MPARKYLYLVATLLLFALLAWLGIRTLQHEVVMRHYQAQLLAQAQAQRVESAVNALMQQKATRMNAIGTMIAPGDIATLRALAEKDNEIEAAFTLREGQLLWPDTRQPLTQREREWARLLAPIVADPSLLYSHAARDEHRDVQSGWYITNDNQIPLLIYWQRTGKFITGFRLSYVQLMMEAASGLQIDAGKSGTVVRLTENDRQLYQNVYADTRSRPLLESKMLSYPLNGWKISVWGQNVTPYRIYLWGGLMIILLIAAVALFGFSVWREYTRSVRLARQQVDFVSQVSHELKTPLTNITLYAELLAEGLDDEQQQEQRYLDVITQEGQRLSRLIQNILTFTRVPKAHLQPVDLTALIDDIIRLFTPAFSAKGITIQFSASQRLIVHSDRDYITQIVSNFLSNADKYAASGKRVDLSLQQQGDSAAFIIRDYGPGMTEKEIKKIFQPFYRVKSAINEGVSGTGIGLTIALQLAQRLGGTIEVSPQKPGLQFSLLLPLTASQQG